MRTANTYALAEVGNAANATITACCDAGKSSHNTSTIAHAGRTTWRIASSAAANPGPSRSAPKRSPAPTAIKPSGSAALPMRCSVVAANSGSRSETALHSRPATVAMINGLRANSRR
jgi:hypothetical protein